MGSYVEVLNIMSDTELTQKMTDVVIILIATIMREDGENMTEDIHGRPPGETRM